MALTSSFAGAAMLMTVAADTDPQLSANVTILNEELGFHSERILIMESGNTIVNEQCALTDGGDIQCQYDIYMARENMVIQDHQAPHDNAQSIMVTYDLDDDGLSIEGVAINQAGESRFVDQSSDREVWQTANGHVDPRRHDESPGTKRAFQSLREDRPFDIDEYDIESGAPLTPIELAHRNDPTSNLFDNQLRPVDDLYFIQETPNGMSHTNYELISSTEEAFDIDESFSRRGISLTKEFDGTGANGNVQFTISFDGITSDNTLSSASVQFDRGFGVLNQNQMTGENEYGTGVKDRADQKLHDDMVSIKAGGQEFMLR